MPDATPPPSPAERWASKTDADRINLWRKLASQLREAADLLGEAGAPLGELRALQISARNLHSASAVLVKTRTQQPPCCEDARLFGSCQCATLTGHL
jgi:hypothetical protein